MSHWASPNKTEKPLFAASGVSLNDSALFCEQFVFSQCSQLIQLKMPYTVPVQCAHAAALCGLTQTKAAATHPGSLHSLLDASLLTACLVPLETNNTKDTYFLHVHF